MMDPAEKQTSENGIRAQKSENKQNVKSFRDRKADLRNLIDKILDARNLDEILIDLKQEIIRFFNIERMTLYVIDGAKMELVSRFMSESEISEIRIPISKKSIAGYAALKQRTLNISDVSDRDDLSRIDPDLNFDETWDEKTGFATKQILAVPIVVREFMMGVMELINRKRQGSFTAAEVRTATELAKAVGIALYKQKRTAMISTDKYNYLIQNGILTPGKLKSAISDAARRRVALDGYLRNTLHISKELLGKSLSAYFGTPFIDFDETLERPTALLRGLKVGFLRNNLWVPLGGSGNSVIVAIDDPFDSTRLYEIKSIFPNTNIDLRVALKEDILAYIQLFSEKAGKNDTVDNSHIEDSADTTETKLSGNPNTFDDESEMETENAVSAFLSKMVSDALLGRATAIHIEPYAGDQSLVIRFRIDGVCGKYRSVPWRLRNEIISRIKLMAGLNPAERVRPQSGKIRFKRKDDKDIEIRVTIIPLFGGTESAVLHVQAPGELNPLEKIGFDKDDYHKLIDIIQKPYGIVLVSGPSGSGITTLLHSMLLHLNDTSKKIWTIENPVEIMQPGISQINIDPSAGFDFSRAMQSVLLADPDIVMIGLINDATIAQSAVDAALGGRLVFAGIHAENAADTITRLIEMGVDSQMLSHTLQGIVSQRLVRVLCDECREVWTPSKEEFKNLVEEYGQDDAQDQKQIQWSDNIQFFREKGCDACEKTGYRGRVPVNEILPATQEMRRLIKMKLDTDDILWQAKREGMKTLKQKGIEKVLAGITDLKEIHRTC